MRKLSMLPLIIIMSIGLCLLIKSPSCSEKNIIHLFQESRYQVDGSIQYDGIILCPSESAVEMNRSIIDFFKKNFNKFDASGSESSRSILLYIENGKFNKEFVDEYVREFKHLDVDESNYSENFIGQIRLRCSKRNPFGLDTNGHCFWEYIDKDNRETFLGLAEFKINGEDNK